MPRAARPPRRPALVAPRAALALLAALALARPRPAAAQAPADRAALAAWRDSLDRLADSTAVLRVERAAKAALRARREDPLLETRLALVELRLGDLGKPFRYDDAGAGFRRAERAAPGWPWPVYGRALARFGASEAARRDPLALGTRNGVGELADAIGLLARAVTLDPAFAPALDALARIPFRFRDPEAWRVALAALRAAEAAHPDASPGALLALGRLEREVGSPDTAIAAFERYLATGADPGLAHLELARTRLATGRPGGAADYYAGAASDDSATVAGYRADLAFLVADSVLRELDAAHGAARVAFLRRFWASRDADELRRSGERLAEHYRRLAYARRHFALATTKRVYWPGSGCTVRTGSTELDDRGVIYVRHGEPTSRVRTPLFQMMPNESWRYARPDGDLLFHFGAGSDVDDYRLLESVLDLYQGCSGPRETRYMPQPTEVLLSRQELDPMYGRLAAWYGTSAGERELARERGLGRWSIATGTTTDSYELRFAAPLPVAIRYLAVGRASDAGDTGEGGGASLVHVVFAIPGVATHPDATAEGWRHLVRLRLAALDARGTPVVVRDTTLVLYTPAPVPRGAYLDGRLAVPVPPGNWRWRTAVQYGAGDAAPGTLLPRDTLRVGDFGGRRLAVSDLVLGWRPLPLTWQPAPGDTVYFSPFASYARTSDLELYYEVYGLAAGERYRTELVVTSQRKGGLFHRAPAPVRIAADAQAEGPVARGRRTLRLATLAPGRYWLDLVVTDAAGRRDQRRTWFEVVAPEPLR
ncbi:MAG TPA: GWxTD domain-containing protein [Gemmatimonadales bacterium]|nr:GWxTD domain-containing protein [Gemmatimonadales bacterium]